MNVEWMFAQLSFLVVCRLTEIGWLFIIGCLTDTNNWVVGGHWLFVRLQKRGGCLLVVVWLIQIIGRLIVIGFLFDYENWGVVCLYVNHRQYEQGHQKWTWFNAWTKLMLFNTWTSSKSIKKGNKSKFHWGWFNYGYRTIRSGTICPRTIHPKIWILFLKNTNLTYTNLT